MDDSAGLNQTDAIAGDLRLSGFTTPISFPNPANMAAQDDVTCVGCRQNFGTKRYDCAHVVCEGCYRRSDLGAICPFCGMATPFHMIKDIGEGPSVIRCVSDQAAAEFYCHNCDDFYCAKCNDAHARVKLSKDHQIDKIPSALCPPSRSSTMCPTHRNEQLSMFCDQCSSVSCRVCMNTVHQGHQSGSTDLTNVEIQKSLLSVLVSSFPQKTEIDRKANSIMSRMQSIEQVRSAAKEDIKKAVETISAAVKRRVTELFAEIDRRCENERKHCDDYSKAMRELVILSSYVKRLISQACEKEQTSADQSLLHLVHFAMDKLRVVNNSPMRFDMKRPVVSLAIPVDGFLHQAAALGIFDPPSPACYQSRPSAAAPVNQFATSTAPTYVVQGQRRFPMPNPMGTYYQSGTPVAYQPGNGAMRAYMQQNFQQHQPPSSGSTAYNYGSYQGAYRTYAQNSQFPSCVYQTQPFTSIRVPHGSGQQHQMAPPGYQHSAAMPGQPHINPNPVSGNLAPTPPANGVFTPSPPALYPMVQQNSNVQQPLAVDRLLQQWTAHPTPIAPGSCAPAKRGGNNPKGSRTSAQKKTKPPGSQCGKRNKPQQRSRQGSKSSSPAMTFVPPSVGLIVDAVANSEHSPLRRMLASSTPLLQPLSVSVEETSQNQGNASCDSGAPRSVLSEFVSPCEGRLVIDESATDSGIENAIEIEMMETESGTLNKEIKQEESNESMSSATGAVTGQEHGTTGELERSADGVYDDYCCVCGTDDGRPVRRCSNTRCGRLFHGSHHVPSFDLSSGTNEPWICTYCIDLVALKVASAISNSPNNGLTKYEQAACERMLLELYSCSNSEMFHEPVDRSFDLYYSRVRSHVDFSLIRKKLAGRQYLKCEDVLGDMNLLFNNFYDFYQNVDPIRTLVSSVGECYSRLVSMYFPDLVSKVSLLHKTRQSIDNGTETYCGTGPKRSRQE